MSCSEGLRASSNSHVRIMSEVHTPDGPIVPPEARLSGSGRASTPGRSRAITPQERSASAGRKAIVEATRSSSPYSSRQGMGKRRKRRWVNDKLLGAAMLQNIPPEELSAQLSSLDIRDDAWSKLTQLLHRAPELLAAFRAGKIPMQNAPLANGQSDLSKKLEVFEGTSHRKGTLARFQDAAYLFSKVDKRLRGELHREVRRSYATKSDANQLAWLPTMEHLLMQFADEPETFSEHTLLPPVISDSMISPLRVVDRQSTRQLHFLYKNGLHRLLMHGLCQFHGITSKSTDQKDGKRILRVYAPSRNYTVAPCTLFQYLTVLHDAEHTSSQQQRCRSSSPVRVAPNSNVGLNDRNLRITLHHNYFNPERQSQTQDHLQDLNPESCAGLDHVELFNDYVYVPKLSYDGTLPNGHQEI